MNNKIILKIGVSTRALFDLEKENEIYEKEGLEAYIKYNEDNIDTILQEGVAFRIVKKLLMLNKYDNINIDIILMSRACPQISTRIFRSLEYYNLRIEEAFFTGGESLARYVKNSDIDLYLSANEHDVKAVLESGIAAGLIHISNANYSIDSDDLRVAFDCDQVLFSDESDKIFEKHGLEKYELHEKKKANKPIKPGPFKNLIVKLGLIQEACGYNDNNPIKIAICTARGYSTHERCMNTLKSWGVRVSQAFFLAGNNKAIALAAFNADIFFDDSNKNINGTSDIVPSCQVLSK